VSSTPLYSTTTGQEPVVLGDLLDEIAALLAPQDPEPFCFLCNRCTDHFAEHDTEVYDLGTAFYGADGTVYSRAETWAWERRAALEAKVSNAPLAA
jgi:hypothetical protein